MYRRADLYCGPFPGINHTKITYMSLFKKRKNDVQVGNYVYHIENGYVKVKDVAGNTSHRISTLTLKGRFVLDAIRRYRDDKSTAKWLENYSAIMLNVLLCVPDNDFFADLNTACLACISRHKNLYSIKEDISKEEDDAILEEEKNRHEAMEVLKHEGQN